MFRQFFFHFFHFPFFLGKKYFKKIIMASSRMFEFAFFAFVIKRKSKRDAIKEGAIQINGRSIHRFP